MLPCQLKRIRRSLSASLLVAFSVLMPLAFRPPATLAQFKPSHSEEDLNAIGHRTLVKGLDLYSLDKENELGKAMAQQVERSSRVVDDPVVADYLNRIAQTIAKNSDAKFPITVRIVDSKEINAFTLPGGYQYVNRGLILTTETEAELAAALAHGIAHTALRSGTAQATRGAPTQLLAIPAMIFIPDTWAGYAMYQRMNLAIPPTFLKFARDAERAADFYAVQYLYKAGYSAEGYPLLLEHASSQPNQQNIPKVFSTHPPLSERLKATGDEIARLLPPRDTEIVSSSEFEALKERLRAWQPKAAPCPQGNPERPTLRRVTEPPNP